MEFNDVITERYSVRGYLDKEVEKEKLEYVLKAKRRFYSRKMSICHRCC